MSATNFTKLNIVIDNSSTKTASKELEKLGNVSTAAEGKIRKLASAVGALTGTAKFGGTTKEIDSLAAWYSTLGAAMESAGRNGSHSSAEMEAQEKQLRAASVSALELHLSLSGAAANNAIALSATKENLEGELKKQAKNKIVINKTNKDKYHLSGTAVFACFTSLFFSFVLLFSCSSISSIRSLYLFFAISSFICFMRLLISLLVAFGNCFFNSSLNDSSGSIPNFLSSFSTLCTSSNGSPNIMKKMNRMPIMEIDVASSTLNHFTALAADSGLNSDMNPP